jgi:molecular chaperone GrpE (heat shock protein)
MSCSDDVLGWSAFRERAVPAPIELRSPASELSAALQRGARSLAAERAATRDAQADANDADAELAVLVFHLSTVLNRHEDAVAEAGLNDVHRELCIVRNQMLAALKHTDVLVVDPLGRPFDEVGDAVQVVGWRHGNDFPDEVVAETIEPIVHHGADVIRPGRVIMGAPATNSGPGKENA